MKFFFYFILLLFLLIDTIFFSIRYIWGNDISLSLIMDNIGLFEFNALFFFWKEFLAAVTLFLILSLLLYKYQLISFLVLLIINTYILLPVLKFHRHSEITVHENIYEKYLTIPKIAKGTGKNIILIVLESMDMRFTSLPGEKGNENFIPFLSELRQKGIFFDGFQKVKYTYSTMPGYWGLTCGIPKGSDDPTFSFSFRNMAIEKAVCITDLLNKKGYKNIHVRGAPLRYGGMKSLGDAHHYDLMVGYFEIQKQNSSLIPSDITTLKHNKEKNNYEITGLKMYPDSVVFETAKNILNKQAPKGKFFISILTGNTHGPNRGYTESSCGKKYQDIRDAYKCSDKIIYEFVLWAQQQSWYKDTIILLVGDHLVWNKTFERLNTKVDSKLIHNESLSQTYNLLLNSDLKEGKITRKFSQFDYPATILEAAGFKLLPRKLGLGNSLFNGEERNLVEILGREKLNKYLEESIPYFDNYFVK